MVNKLSFSKYINKNVEKQLTRAAREEYLVKNAVKIQINIKNNPRLVSYANIEPIKTAIPFPPLNFIHIGKRCPIITETIAISMLIKSIELKNFIGRKAFKTSKNNVRKPNLIPLILKIFVAPIFLEPANLGSSFFRNFDNNKPNGIDPNR